MHWLKFGRKNDGVGPRPRKARLSFGLLYVVVVVSGSLLGFCLQAALGSRDWSSIPISLLPVLLGATLGHLVFWVAHRLGKPRKRMNRQVD